MKKRLVLLLTLILPSMIFMIDPIFTDYASYRDFSANCTTRIVIDDDAGEFEIDFSFAKSGDKFRAEYYNISASKDSGDTPYLIFISRPDKKVSWAIFPDSMTYLEIKEKDTMDIISELSIYEVGEKIEIEKRLLGTETVNGYKCNKYKGVYTNSEGEEVEVFSWCAKELEEFPVRTEVLFEDQEGNMASLINEFRDIELVKPDQALFELPDKYSAVDEMPSDIGIIMDTGDMFDDWQDEPDELDEETEDEIDNLKKEALEELKKDFGF